MLTKLDLLSEFLDESVSLASAPLVMKKYDLIFESCPEALRLHQSIVETLGVSNVDRFHIIVTDIVDDVEAGRYPDIDCMNSVGVLVDALEELMQDATHADANIQGSGASFYKSYLQSVVHNSDYWLSDIELL